MSDQAAGAHVQLAPLPSADIAAWTAASVRGFAAQQVGAGLRREPDATDYAQRQLRHLLPYGPLTPGHCLWSMYDGGALVGHAWLHLRPRPTGVEGYLLDIDVAVPHRRRGVGRAGMLAVEGEARRRGAVAMGLNVFGHNVAARALYSGLGYTVVESTWVLELPRHPVLRPVTRGGATAPAPMTGADVGRARSLLRLQHRDDGLHALVGSLEFDTDRTTGRSRGGPGLLRAVRAVAAESGARTLTVAVIGSSRSTWVLLDEGGFTLAAQTMTKPL